MVKSKMRRTDVTKQIIKLQNWVALDFSTVNFSKTVFCVCVTHTTSAQFTFPNECTLAYESNLSVKLFPGLVTGPAEAEAGCLSAGLARLRVEK